MTTLKSLLEYGREELKRGGIEDAANDAWLLLEYVCGVSRSHYYVYPQETVAEEMAEAYRRLVGQRKGHIPLQHLTQEAWFMGLPFYVNEHVLIPRQDTECLVEEALKRGHRAKRVLDMCTGSGCILLSLLHTWKLEENREVKGLGADLSPAALEVAERNRERLGIEAELVQSNLFENIKGTYDMIISNPPYIPTQVIGGLMAEVRDHEPRMALDGGRDGYDFYREIVQKSPGFLNQEGWLCLEIGYDQGQGVKTLLEAEGFQNIQIIQDLAGLDRVAAGQWKI